MQYTPHILIKLIVIVLFHSMGYFKYMNKTAGLLRVNNSQGLIG